MRNLSFIVIVLLFFKISACSIFGGSDHEITIYEPFEITVQGIINEEISSENFDIHAEWTQIATPDEVHARFFSSKRDTIGNKILWQRYHLSIARNHEWPAEGTLGVTSLDDMRQNKSDQFFLRMSSLYRELPVNPDEENFMLLLDHTFIATDGTLNITTATDQYLRGEFNLMFMLLEKRQWDMEKEIIEGPADDALEIRGAFELDLLRDRVTSISIQ